VHSIVRLTSARAACELMAFQFEGRIKFAHHGALHEIASTLSRYISPREAEMVYKVLGVAASLASCLRQIHQGLLRMDALSAAGPRGGHEPYAGIKKR
jgi:hypothetical protein